MRWLFILIMITMTSCVDSSKIVLEEFVIAEVRSGYVMVKNNCGEVFTVPSSTLGLSDGDIWQAYFNQAIIDLYRDGNLIYRG